MHRLKIVFSQDSPPKLSEAEGRFLSSLIHKHTGLSLSDYSVKIGMDRTLLSRYLNGQINITQDALRRIISGIQYERDGKQFSYVAIWEQQIVIRETQSGEWPKPNPCDSPTDV